MTSPRTTLMEAAAYMVRGTGVCERPHRNGEANPHIHFGDDYIRLGARIARATEAIEAEVRADLAEKVRGLVAVTGMTHGSRPGGDLLTRAAVLALLEDTP